MGVVFFIYLIFVVVVVVVVVAVVVVVSLFITRLDPFILAIIQTRSQTRRHSFFLCCPSIFTRLISLARLPAWNSGVSLIIHQ